MVNFAGFLGFPHSSHFLVDCQGCLEVWAPGVPAINLPVAHGEVDSIDGKGSDTCSPTRSDWN